MYPNNANVVVDTSPIIIFINNIITIDRPVVSAVNIT